MMKRLPRPLAALSIVVVLALAYVAGVMSPYLLPGVAAPVYLAASSVLKPAVELYRNITAEAFPAYPSAAMNANTFAVIDNDRSLSGHVVLALFGTSPSYHSRVVKVDRAGHVTWEYVAAGRVSDVRELANGDILFNTLDTNEAAAARNAVVTGGTVYEIAPDKHIVRQQRVAVTHHAELLPNGNLLLADAANEVVSEVDPSGRTVWKWDAHERIKAYTAANFVGDLPSLIIRNVFTSALENPALAGTDWIHINSAQRLDNGDTVISLRNFDLVLEVDQAGNPVWSYGPLVLKHQHCAFVLPNDHLLVSDNGNARIIEVDRKTQQIVWSYDDNLLFAVQGCAYRLPNGNTLITDSAHLRVLEVTMDKRVAWQLTVKTPGTSPLYRAWWSPN